MVAIAVTDSGRPLARVGGLTKNQIRGEDGLRQSAEAPVDADSLVAQGSRSSPAVLQALENLPLQGQKADPSGTCATTFEQLPVWHAAIDLAAAVYAMIEKPPFRRRYSLRDQIERAAISISNNIAEGFERGTKQELLTFLYVARGSAGEVRSMLSLLRENPSLSGSGIRNLDSEIAGREHLQATGRMDPYAPGLRAQGLALRHREGATGGPQRPRPPRVP